MDTLINLFSTSFKTESENDVYVLLALETVKNIDEWNDLISKLESIPLRARIETSGVINQILGGQA